MKKLLNAWKSMDALEVVTQSKKEASREVGEMIRWKDNHKRNDPDGMLWEYESLFPLVKKAERYRMGIYNRNKEIEKIKFDITVAHVNQDQEELDRLNEKWSNLEAEQIGLAWKIAKIYFFLRGQVIISVGDGVDEVFKDFEYDLDKS